MPDRIRDQNEEIREPDANRDPITKLPRVRWWVVQLARSLADWLVTAPRKK
jgi:hypothetical protein